jgi:hypothetical protein
MKLTIHNLNILYEKKVKSLAILIIILIESLWLEANY